MPSEDDRGKLGINAILHSRLYAEPARPPNMKSAGRSVGWRRWWLHFWPRICPLSLARFAALIYIKVLMVIASIAGQTHT